MPIELPDPVIETNVDYVRSDFSSTQRGAIVVEVTVGGVIVLTCWYHTSYSAWLETKKLGTKVYREGHECDYAEDTQEAEKAALARFGVRLRELFEG